MTRVETVLDRKTVRLRRAGGSRGLTLPLRWLRQIGVPDDVAVASLSMLLQEGRIILEPAATEVPSIEDDPAFPAFLDFLAHEALMHPEALVNAADVLADDEDLVPPNRKRVPER